MHGFDAGKTGPRGPEGWSPMNYLNIVILVNRSGITTWIVNTKFEKLLLHNLKTLLT